MTTINYNIPIIPTKPELNIKITEDRALERIITDLVCRYEIIQADFGFIENKNEAYIAILKELIGIVPALKKSKINPDTCKKLKEIYQFCSEQKRIKTSFLGSYF